MKRLIMAAGLVLGLAGSGAADPVLGTWKTQEDEGAFAHVAMETCGGAICGTIARTFRAEGEYSSPNIGKPLLWDMQSQGDGRYNSGRIWQPSTDKVFKSKMALSGDVLNVSGCWGPICKRQVWTRVR